MLISAIDKLKAALAKRRLSTPTSRAALARFILIMCFISCNRDANPQKDIPALICNNILEIFTCLKQNYFVAWAEEKQSPRYNRVWWSVGCARCAISIFRPRGSVTQGTRLLPKPLIILKTKIFGRLSKMKQKDRQQRSNTLKNDDQ